MKMIEIKEKTAIIEIGGKQRELPIWKNAVNNNVTIFGIAVRYPQGNKVWKGMVTYWIDSKRFNNAKSLGMDRRQLHNYVSIVGFYDDMKDDYKSLHKGNWEESK